MSKSFLKGLAVIVGRDNVMEVGKLACGEPPAVQFALHVERVAKVGRLFGQGYASYGIGPNDVSHVLSEVGDKMGRIGIVKRFRRCDWDIQHLA